MDRLSSGHCCLVRNQEEIISFVSLVLNQGIVKAGTRRGILNVTIALIEKSVRNISINDAINNFRVVPLLGRCDGINNSLNFVFHEFLLESGSTNSVSVYDNLVR